MCNESFRGVLAEVSASTRGVLLAYLFGSRLGEHLGPMSDYDVAVLLEEAVDAFEARARMAHDLARALQSHRVDVVVLNDAPVELAYAVIAQGEIAFEQDTATRVEYEATVLSRYGDYLPVLRALRDDILRGDEHAHRVHRYRSAVGRTERTLGQITPASQQGPGRV